MSSSAHTSTLPCEKIIILGAGNVGLGLALALQHTPHQLLAIWSRGEKQRLEASDLLKPAPTLHESFIGASAGSNDFIFPSEDYQNLDLPQLTNTPLDGQKSLNAANKSKVPQSIYHPVVVEEFSNLPIKKATLIIISVSDDGTEVLAKRLLKTFSLSHQTIVAHTSGCLTSRIIPQEGNHFCATLHPLTACPDPRSAGYTLRTARYMLEGDHRAEKRLTHLVTTIGGKPQWIETAQKVPYHTAAVISSNLMVALFAEAMLVLEQAGLEDCETAFLDLAVGALERVRTYGAVKGLTGPVARGDKQTLTKHLNALEEVSPESVALYKMLSLSALSLAEQKGLGSEALSHLGQLLGKRDDRI